MITPQLLMIEGDQEQDTKEIGVVWTTVAAGAAKGLSAIFKGVKKGVSKKRKRQEVKQAALKSRQQAAANQAAAEQAAAAAEQAAADQKKKNILMLVAAAAIPAALFLLGNPAPAILSGSRRRKPRTRPTLSGKGKNIDEKVTNRKIAKVKKWWKKGKNAWEIEQLTGLDPELIYRIINSYLE